jgi:hypothetical protein
VVIVDWISCSIIINKPIERTSAVWCNNSCGFVMIAGFNIIVENKRLDAQQ